MKKVVFCLALVLSLFLIIETGFADSWICSQCTTENSGNFCGNCGEKKPVSQEWTCTQCGHINTSNFCLECGQQGNSNVPQKSTITNVAFKTEGGYTTITWEDSANKGPYEIYYTTDAWGEYQTKYGMDPYRVKSARIGYLIPGNHYHITITNGVSSTTVDYTVPRVAFVDFKAGMKLELDKDVFQITGNGYYDTFRWTVGYPRLKKTREYYGLLALKTPNGYSSVVTPFQPFQLDKGYIGIYVDEDLSSLLDAVKLNFGSIPYGRYELEMYFDGALYASATFDVYP